MRVGMGRRHPTARCSRQESAMNQIRLNNVFKGSLVLADGRGQRLESDRPPTELLDQSQQKGAVESIETGFVHPEPPQCKSRRIELHSPCIAIAN